MKLILQEYGQTVLELVGATAFAGIINMMMREGGIFFELFREFGVAL